MSKTTYCEGEILFTSKKETTIHSFTESTNFRAGGTQSWTAQTTNHQSYDHSEIQRTTEKANVLILRGKRRKGKDVHGNPHLDLMSNDYTENEAGFNKLYEEIFWENITNGDTNAAHNLNNYTSYKQAAASARANKVTRKIKEFCKKNNKDLFEDFRSDVEYYSSGDLENVVQSMVDKMKTNNSNSTEFSDSKLNLAVRNHENEISFKNSVLEILKTQLNKYSSIKTAVDDLEIKDNGEGKLYPVLVKSQVDSPKFPDKLAGLGIIMNDVWAYEVRISEIKTTKYPWVPQSEIVQIKIDFIYYDHFGLDYPDLEKKRAPSPYIAWDHNVFYEWFILQHFRGFKPFLTKVKNSYEISIIK